jgi:hypothetical protein
MFPKRNKNEPEMYYTSVYVIKMLSEMYAKCSKLVLKCSKNVPQNILKFSHRNTNVTKKVWEMFCQMFYDKWIFQMFQTCSARISNVPQMFNKCTFTATFECTNRMLHTNVS